MMLLDPVLGSKCLFLLLIFFFLLNLDKKEEKSVR